MKFEEDLIKVCLKIAKRGEGALIVVGEVSYKPLVEQAVKSFDITKNPKLLESLALMDGAVIINELGFMTAYGVKIKANKVLKNFGTRHSAGLSASLIKGNTSFVVSEEDRKIRVFKKGKMVMQIDSLEKGIENNVSKIGKVLETIGVGTIGTVGTGILASSVGLAGLSLIPGVIIFGGAYFLIQKLRELEK
jgi:DNA integrity scanning protein DisA with diadenylate cyclase activity